jgi:RNA polymerase sigma-70 factor (ECF subfamily)
MALTMARGDRTTASTDPFIDRSVAADYGDRIDQAVGDSTALADVLDPVALAAADGSAMALDLLVTKVDRHRLAEPAVRRMILNTTDVEDVLQDVLIRLVRSIGAFRGESRFTTWLYRLARNTAIDFLRRRRDAHALPAENAVSDTVRLSSMIATRQSLNELIARLPESYRDPVILRDVQQLPYELVAQKLGLNLNTTKSRIARGRAMLAGLIEGADFDGMGDEGLMR